MKTQKPFALPIEVAVHCRKPNLNHTLNNEFSWENFPFDSKYYPLLPTESLAIQLHTSTQTHTHRPNVYTKRIVLFFLLDYEKRNHFSFSARKNVSLTQAIVTIAVTQTTTKIECFYDDQFNFTSFFYFMEALLPFIHRTIRNCYAVPK